MARLVLKNPYFEEEIKVKESCKRISELFGYMEHGNIEFLTLQQVDPTEALITLHPKNFAKIEVYEGED